MRGLVARGVSQGWCYPREAGKDVFLSVAIVSRSEAIAESKDPYPADYASGNSPHARAYASLRQSASCRAELGVGPAGRLRWSGPGCTEWAKPLRGDGAHCGGEFRNGTVAAQSQGHS